MSGALHTPGPWWLDSDADTEGEWTLMGRGEQTICSLQHFGRKSTAEADARMAAAAPELYDACESNRLALIAIADSAVEAGFDKLADIIDAELAKANAALAKARGEQVQA